MSQEEIQDIIEELNKLDIRQTKLINRLRELNTATSTVQQSIATTVPIPIDPPLLHFFSPRNSNSSLPQVTDYQIGDHVQVLIKVNWVYGSVLTEKQSRGRVTRLTPKRVYIKLDYGVMIQRAPHNVKHL